MAPAEACQLQAGPHARVQATTADRPHPLPHPPVLERGAQLLLRLPRLGRQQQAAGGLVQAVHVPRPAQRTHLLRGRQRMRQQGEHRGHCSATAARRAAPRLAERRRAAAAAASQAGAALGARAGAAAAAGRRVARHALRLDHACQVIVLKQHRQLHSSCSVAGRASGHRARQPVARGQLHRRARPLHALQQLAARQGAAGRGKGGGN